MAESETGKAVAAAAAAAAATCSIVVEVTFDCLLEIRRTKTRKGEREKGDTNEDVNDG